MLKNKKNIDEIMNCLRNRSLSQKFVYIGEGARNYYEYDKSTWGKLGKVTFDGFKSILNKNIKGLNSNKILFISMGCGDSHKELEILESFNNKNIKYIGIDYSDGMLNLSKKSLKNANFEYELLKLDISDKNIKEILDEKSIGFDERIFSFIGNTFGNTKSTNIVDLLGYFTNKGDKLLMDIASKGDGVKDNINIFNRSKNRLKDSFFINFLQSGLESINFPLNKTELALSAEGDENSGIFRIKVFIKILERIEYENGSEKVIFGKGDILHFFDFYYYFIDKLIKFMKLHKFNYVDGEKKGVWEQLIFEKQ